MRTTTTALLTATLLGTGAHGAGGQTAPRAADVATPEAIVAAAYAAINREPGAPSDWDRFRSLHLPDARLVPNTEQRDGRTDVLGVEDFIRWIDEATAASAPIGSEADQGFYEEGVHAVIQRYGDVAQVMSTYTKRLATSDQILGRGINAFTLVWDGDRWWILSIAWDEEIGAGPIPERYLPGGADQPDPPAPRAPAPAGVSTPPGPR